MCTVLCIPQTADNRTPPRPLPPAQVTGLLTQSFLHVTQLSDQPCLSRYICSLSLLENWKKAFMFSLTRDSSTCVLFGYNLVSELYLPSLSEHFSGIWHDYYLLLVNLYLLEYYSKSTQVEYNYLFKNPNLIS